MKDAMTRDSRLQTGSMMLLVFVAALALRIPVAMWLPEQVIWPDGARYERVALNLLEGSGFGDMVDNRRSVPTQPLLIAGVYSVFGKSYLALRLVSAVIGAISCVVGFLLARSLFGATVGVLAGLTVAVYPHLVYLNALFEFPQTLGILFMTTFLWLLYRFYEQRKLSTLFMGSVMLGATVLTLPTLLLFVPVFVLLALKRDADWRRNLSYVAVAAMGVVITVGAWAWRNYAAYDHVILVNAASGVNFWAANNEAYARWGKEGSVPMCTGPHGVTSYCLEHRQIRQELLARNLTDTEYALAEERAAWEHGLRFVRESPGRFIELSFTRFLRLWSPWPDAVHTGPARGGSQRNAISAIAYIPLALLALAGLILSARTHARKLIPLYLLVAVFVAPFAVFLPTMRYRFPIDFLLAIFAAIPLAHLWRLAVNARLRRTTNAKTIELA
jgi:4-amino-4-deoxy-L-arabinose transferase-like glycosyltransferase